MQIERQPRHSESERFRSSTSFRALCGAFVGTRWFQCERRSFPGPPRPSSYCSLQGPDFLKPRPINGCIGHGTRRTLVFRRLVLRIFEHWHQAPRTDDVATGLAEAGRRQETDHGVMTRVLESPLVQGRQVPKEGVRFVPAGPSTFSASGEGGVAPIGKVRYCPARQSW